MSNKWATVLFVRPIIMKFSVFIFLMLSLLLGGGIIYSIENLKGPFQVYNIYSVFSTVSNFLLMYAAINAFSREFRYKTINHLRISGRSSIEIILRKLLAVEFLAILTSLVSFVEVAFYKIYFNHPQIDLFEIFNHLVPAYLVYALFLFSLGSIITLVLKNSLYSFITLFLTLRLGVTIMNVMNNFESTADLTKYIPLSFVENAFSFAKYTPEQYVVTIVWSVALMALLPVIYRKWGYA